MNNELLLSIFPGIDILGKGFEQNGFCVVQAQDKILGGDIINFKPPTGVFAGVIGGSPCQDFSSLNRNPSNYSYLMLDEYCRVVSQASPDWFLFENVARAPDFNIEGYKQQRFALDLAWFNGYTRLRNFAFGSKNGTLLNPMIKTKAEIKGGCVVGNDKRSFRVCCDIQGLPRDFDLPELNAEGKKQVVANAVPLQIAHYIASLIKKDYYKEQATKPPENSVRLCLCGCKRRLLGKAHYASATCRKRAQRARERL